MTSDALPDAVSNAVQPNDGLWARWRTTPWRDALRGRLSGSLDYRRMMVGHDLPQPLLQTVDEVVRRTRLWPREKCDVAAELCAHFADGLQAGQSVEQLQQTFGSARDASKLIRRAKLRCRPWLWRARRRTWQTMAVLALALAAIWSVLLIRFVTAKPTVTFDIVADYDKESRAIPEEDRAWPLYREGLVRLSREELRGYEFPVMKALEAGPSNPHWPEARQYLIEHEDAVDWFLRATSKPELGFINRDPENAGWLAAREYGDWETYNGPDTPGYLIALAQAQDLRAVMYFLAGSAHLAVEEADGPRVVTLLSSMLRLPDHARQTFNGLYITDLVAFALLRTSANLVARIVLEHPDPFTDDDLEVLSECLANGLGGESARFQWEGEQRIFDDFLQRSFTDDGDGHGRFTPKGLQDLKTMATYQMSDQNAVLEWMPGDSASTDAEAWNDLLFLLFGSAAVTMVGDRHTVRAEYLELVRLKQRAIADIHAGADVDAYLDAVHHFKETSSIRHQVLPVAVMFSGGNRKTVAAGSRLLAATNLARDAALVAIALEQHRRRTGDWPESLALLAPDLLAEVPRDLYAVGDAPLTYRVVDGRPMLYSVGPNRQDDGGVPAADGKSFWEAEDGDWVLLPPREPDW